MRSRSFALALTLAVVVAALPLACAIGCGDAGVSHDAGERGQLASYGVRGVVDGFGRRGLAFHEAAGGFVVRGRQAPGARLSALVSQGAGAAAVMRLRVDDVTASVREVGARTAQLEGSHVRRERDDGGTSFVIGDGDGLDQWILGARTIAFEIDGANVVLRDGRAEIVDERGVAQLELAVLPAVRPSGDEVGARLWLTARPHGARVELVVDAPDALAHIAWRATIADAAVARAPQT